MWRFHSLQKCGIGNEYITAVIAIFASLSYRNKLNGKVDTDESFRLLHVFTFDHNRCLDFFFLFSF